MLLARGNISALLGVNVTRFVPPFNSWNADTLTAMSHTGYNMISSEVDQDPGPYNFNNPGKTLSLNLLTSQLFGIFPSNQQLELKHLLEVILQIMPQIY